MEDRSSTLPPNRRQRHDLILALPPQPIITQYHFSSSSSSYNNNVFTFQNGLNLNEAAVSGTYNSAANHEEEDHINIREHQRRHMLFENPRIIPGDNNVVGKDHMISPQPSDFLLNPHLVDPMVVMAGSVQGNQWMQLSSTTSTSFEFPAKPIFVKPVMEVVGNYTNRDNNNPVLVESCVSNDASKDVVDDRVERKQRRMIKNRESAARSRARKQAYTNQLEEQVIQLRKANSWLKKQKEVCEHLFSSSEASESRYQLRRTSSTKF